MSEIGKFSEWKITTIGEVFTLIGGGTPSTNNNAFWGSGIPWFSSADIDAKGELKIRRFVTVLGVEKSATNIVPSGSLIVVTRVGLGKVAVTYSNMCFSQDMQALIPKDSKCIYVPFFKYQVMTAANSIKFQGRGTTIQGITKKQLAEIPIVIPSVADQERIVLKIDEIFSEIDKGVEALQKAKEQLKVYRQAVLKDAFEGKFSKSSPSDWEIVTAKKLVKDGKHSFAIGPFGSDLKVSDYTNNGVPLVFVRDIRNSFSVRPSKYVTNEKANKLKAHRVTSGDLLITKMGDPPGDCVIYSSVNEAIITADCIKMSINESVALSKYVMYFIISPFGKAHIRLMTQGVAQKKVSLERFKRLILPLPSIQEQEIVLNSIESRLSVCDKIEQTVDESLLKSECLRQTILKKAFEGKLV